MTILRHYTMRARPGHGSDLGSALIELTAKVAPFEGCLKVELYRDPGDPDTYVFIEHWASVEDHEAAGAALGRGAFAPIIATVADRPAGRYLEAVALD